MGNIKNVRSNIKVCCDVELGPKTIIVGPNGSGKSTIINAIELALTGRAGDIAGRAEVAREVEVMSLAPAGVTELYSSVEFDDGVIAAYRTSGSTAKAKKATGDKPEPYCHDEVLPLRSLREALLGSPTTARKYLLGKVSGAVSRNDVKALLLPPAWPLWDKLIDAVPSAVTTADALVSVLEESGRRQRAANEEAKTARGAAKLVGDGASAPPTAAEIAEAKERVKEAREAYSKAEARASAVTRLAAAEERLNEASEKAQAVAKEYAAAKAALDAIPPPSENADLLVALDAVMAQSVDRGACLPCGGSAKGMADRLAEVRALAETDAKNRAAREAADRVVLAKYREAESALAVLDTLEQGIADIRAEVGAAGDLASFDATAESIALDNAQKHLASLNARKDNWAVVQRSEATAQDAERRAADWKILKDSCESAVGTVLNRAVSQFIANVQAHLPDGDVFDLRLRDGDREVVQFGLVRNGTLHTALSGAEWARVTVAMAEACVGPDKYACLIPEERAFDPKTLSNVLKALTDSPHQVIVASPVAPKPLPKGWTLIERG